MPGRGSAYRDESRTCCVSERVLAHSSHRKGLEQLGLPVALVPDGFNLWALMTSRRSNAMRSSGCILCPVAR
eukprot:10127308-Alexandrium_andersonii.AAC.1